MFVIFGFGMGVGLVFSVPFKIKEKSVEYFILCCCLDIMGMS